ncbi:MAG: site-specific integrase [Candidatus Dadabacteria bacterium]|nr:site-specific integrase [Candidatus Dadabacteria bacterium]
MGVFKRYHESKDGSKTPYWYFRLWYNGREIKRSVGEAGIVTKTQAKRVMEETKRRLRLGEYDIIDARIPTISEFAEEYKRYVRDVKKKRSWWRDDYSLRHILGFFRDKKLSELAPKDIDDYKLSRLSKAKPATVNRELEVLRHLYNLAKRWRRFFGSNPVSESGLLEVHNQKERILTPDEEQRLLSCSPSYLKPIITTALNTGMRKSEILTLTWDAVDFENNLITVGFLVSKSKRTRKIPINATLKTVLLEQKLKGGGSEYVILSSNGNPYKRHDSLKQAFGKALRDADIEGLRFHDLRHTAATRMVESGANIVAVSTILGHADLKTTMRYAHLDDSLREAVEKLGNFGSNRTENRTSEKTEEV